MTLFLNQTYTNGLYGSFIRLVMSGIPVPALWILLLLHPDSDMRTFLSDAVDVRHNSQDEPSSLPDN